ncbi:M14 family zinc carboxypeptidase [Streptomyces sp. NBC_00873]|uniref:M14 family zinc carboxypeptidase n=1 Tax=unclassified Streptomyces TaxID=2593676 RepID=UPI00386C693B|nr:M14 family zinc carboxypeptidase [Streptomyces sp. NBC_00873]WSY96830.1 M14 family zinc carboxypeptidase [Streptomyces sp. NBC_00873]WTA41397.1 M14 family zinc carboxypeptidase [Streptomyces sp. NBC_00842]WTA48500.1 M14 family zinc carboxypeptidase [Streptomyces sp. NBC_00842]
MIGRRTLLGAAGALAAGLAGVSTASADPAHLPGGPCIQPDQNVSLASVAGYDDVVRQLDRIARNSHGLVNVGTAGLSGEGRKLLYATVGTGPTVFWLQARIHGDELHSTEAVLQILGHLASGDPAARLIREKLTVVVLPMYNPDGAEANIRQSTTPTRTDLNRDWENFAQPESVAYWKLWRRTAPQLGLDLHHMGQAPVVAGTNDLNQFQIGARSIAPSRMTAEQWLTNRQMAMVSVDALDHYGLANAAHYPLIDITNAVFSRMLMGGTAPADEQPVLHTSTKGAIFYEVRSVGQKSNGQLERLFTIPTMAVLTAAADGSLGSYNVSGYGSLPFAVQEQCGGS